MRQIKSFGVLQTAKVMAAIYFFIGLVLVAIVMIAPTRRAHVHRPLVLLLAAPVFYGVVGFIFTAAVCGLYNAIAKRIGGIEFELSDQPGPPPAE